MSGSGAGKLYTTQILGLATALAAYPLRDDLALHAESRSRTCGSTLAIGLDLDEHGAISAIGLNVSACAIGQAAAALFAGDAQGRSASDIARSAKAIENWLGGEGVLPEWEGLSSLEPARAYEARHGAIMLPWNAAIAALSKA